ncbi:MAG TPA: HAMP domain-containing sensor histidine kinase [Thermoflexales bacterium]|nr:HAMP domain-containing sensor histidine kinase [Thermoflexales bacterium]HQX11554.1 HAMP domain-containing sensor histidine kinase [Thermoflexales bacterium]HQY24023.1 HAMP domain-containing sensor histidine kinase [Thermoflexales bacterium]HQZ52769.1 HAMP domain-containing sensor histidine kinase [Thermoflexales bacterium]HRA54308.1 HAMP domain-containing sensor histidine kinase [Thermoflexales bacterium]
MGALSQISIRTRLTVVYTSVTGLTLVIAGLLVYGAVALLLQRQVDDLLRQSYEAITDLTSAALLQNGKVAAQLPTDAFRSIYVQAYDISGELLDASTTAISGPIDPISLRDSRAMAQDARTPLYSTVHVNRIPLRVLTDPVVFTNRVSGQQLLIFFQVATPIQDTEFAKQGLLGTLLAVGLLALLIAAVGGGAVARRAIRPITRITDTALSISRTNNLDQRVLAQTNDEVGRLSTAFNEMLDRLSQSITAQQRFVADVSHEMRTPLTVIRGNVDLLRMGCADTESLDAVTSESDRMTRMVSSLLMLSQADSGALEMRMAPLDLMPTLLEVARAGKFIGQGKTEVTTLFLGEEPLEIEGDADRLKQVLLNLVDNAIKHSPEGAAVHIEAANEAARDVNAAGAPAVGGERVVRVTVSDNGPGIPAEDLPHVFERFYRVDKSRSRAKGGAGLGLAIAQTIAEAHGGRIAARSAVGVGTSFDVFLPAYQPNLV